MIRWITKVLGTAPFDEAQGKTGFSLVDVRDLVDKHGNDLRIVSERIDKVFRLIRQGSPVVICCQHGISRSNAIAAGALALQEGTTFEDALHKVMEATGEKAIELGILTTVRQTLERQKGYPTMRIKKKDGGVLVIGGSGFLGNPVLEKLRNISACYAPTRQELSLHEGPVDLDLYVKAAQVQQVLHMGHPRAFGTPKALGEALVMLKNVLEVCRENKIRLIYLSCWNVFSGYVSESIAPTEDGPVCARGTLGETKILCEKLIESYERQYAIPYVILRSSIVYGDHGDKRKFLYDFLKRASLGQEIVVHRYLNGDPFLDLLHLDDFLSGLLAVVQSDIKGILHLGSGKSISTPDIARMFIEFTGSQSSVRSYSIEEPIGNVSMDISKIYHELGWTPKVDIREGLRNLFTRCSVAEKG